MSQATLREIDVDQLAALAEQVDTYLKDQIKHRPLPANLKEAISYALFGGGKRLRPMLVLHACQAVGGKQPGAMAAAAAIELVHCFSLVHDDLPAMDDSELRRGRLTLHRQTSDAMAVLAGDLMLSLAFEVLASNVCDQDRCARLTRELSIATNDMIAGQVYDTLPEWPVDEDGEELDEVERLELIHSHKTGALIKAACRMGAIAGGAQAAELASITDYAESIGLMFQIVDDLLDVTSTTQALGKDVQADADNGKLTYPGVLGIEASQDEVERLRVAAHTALEAFDDGNAEPLHTLADWLATREK